MINRVLRGWCWGDSPDSLRVDYRSLYDPGFRDDNIGFRCVCRPRASRVLRGGCWSYGPGDLRVADRDGIDPGGRNDGIGFRCVGRG